MRLRQSRNSVSSRVLAFVSISTLISSLAISWIAIDSQRTALRVDLESRHPTALARRYERLQHWLSGQQTDLEQALAAREQWPLLALGLDEIQHPASRGLQIVDAAGAPVAGVLDPAPHRDTLARALPTLATPRELSGPEADIYATATPIGDSGFYLVSSVARAHAFAPARAVALRVLVADVCLVILFTLLAQRITRRILEPIHALSDGARRVSRGELDVRLDLPYPLGPSDEIGLLARTFESMLQRLRTNQREIERTNQQLRANNDELQQANQVLEQLSITDGLTKLHNHRYFQDLLVHESKRLERTGAPLSLMLIDLDDFKQLNDRYGHAAGDQVLSRLAELLNRAIRETDMLARYGGEEFVVLSSGTDLAGACVLAEKIRLTIEQSAFAIDDRVEPLQVTVSIGVALFRGCSKRMFRAADSALYRAKDQGKNCVIEAASEGA
ncbi:MAG: diguanylate cyclase [Myxococcota bacterium]|nr:diguanylate cyclase [Myxococcota bacterium]